MWPNKKKNVVWENFKVYHVYKKFLKNTFDINIRFRPMFNSLTPQSRTLSQRSIGNLTFYEMNTNG